MSALVTLHMEDKEIAVIALNRPEAANALSLKLLDELNVILEQLETNPSIRAVIITGTKEKAFCAGADLKERRGMNEEEVIKTVKYIGDTATRIEELPVPVIAALNGVAFGGGLELALACDIRICAEHVKLGLTETSLAIIPGAGGTQRLPRLIGVGQAKRLIYTATPVDAKEAHALGIVEMAVSYDKLMDSAKKMSKKIAFNGPVAIKQAKKAIDKGIETDLSSGLNIEHYCYKETIATEDRLEGLAAFSEKRKPVYKGK